QGRRGRCLRQSSVGSGRGTSQPPSVRFSKKLLFKGVLRKPPWGKTLYQYEGGDEALGYFVTDNPDEGSFWTTKYDEHLAELQEGRHYLVSGVVYHFESEGKLFLTRCSIRKAD